MCVCVCVYVCVLNFLPLIFFNVLSALFYISIYGNSISFIIYLFLNII